MITSYLPTVARWLHAVALSLWLGGLVAIGALVAPVAFHTLRYNSGLTLMRANGVAGGIIGGSLHLFNIVCYVCGALLLLSNALLLAHANSRWTKACLVTTTLLLASSLYVGLILTPALDISLGVSTSLNDLSTFKYLHHQYEQISTLFQFPLLLLLAWFAALRDGSNRQ